MGVLLLVRHGQASFGAADYDVLSATGETQARRLGEHLRDTGLTPTVLVHGGMRRQRETAEAMADSAGWRVPPEADPRWAEFDHLAVVAAYEPDVSGGDQELDRRAFQEVFARATGRWTSAAHDGDYDETWAQFTQRVRDGLDRAARQAGSGSLAVVVTSGGPIAAACAMLTGAADEHRDLSVTWHRLNAVVVNASVTRVVVGSTGARLLTFNEHSFLGPELVTYR